MSNQLADAVSELEEVACGSASRVADHLYNAGITGYREDECDCPLARWPTQRTGLPVWVNLESIVLEDGDYVAMPDPLAAFVREFDGGAYPDLREL